MKFFLKVCYILFFQLVFTSDFQLTHTEQTFFQLVYSK